MSYWSYPFHPSIKPDFQLDLGQGDTPLQEITETINSIPEINLGQNKIFLKREDLNPNGSFKDRALAYQVSYIYQKKNNYAVISSSGNAAISLAAYAKLSNINAIILVSPQISENKLSQIIKHKPFLIIKSKFAPRLANYISRRFKIPNLRPSKDDNAITGFESLGWEIFQQNPKCNSIFSFTTSGASLLGIFQYYHKFKQKMPKLFSISNLHNINLENICQNNHSNKVNSIKPLRNKNMKNIISLSGGQSLDLPKNDICKYYSLLHKHKINSSIEGAISLAAAIKYCLLKTTNKQNVVVVISGRQRHMLPIPQKFKIHTANYTDDINQLLSNII